MLLLSNGLVCCGRQKTAEWVLLMDGEDGLWQLRGGETSARARRRVRGRNFYSRARGSMGKILKCALAITFRMLERLVALLFFFGDFAFFFSPRLRESLPLFAIGFGSVGWWYDGWGPATLSESVFSSSCPGVRFCQLVSRSLQALGFTSHQYGNSPRRR